MSVFRFKQFSIRQTDNAMKVGTDAMVLGALALPEGKKRALDIGAGTGVLSLMMVQQNTALTMDAIELDERSANECRFNFEASPWGERLNGIHGDFLRHSFTGTYDLIVSNPPYFQSRLENEDTRKATARHESYLPLNPMIEKVAQLLSQTGSFWVIYPAEVENEWMDACKKAGLFPQGVTRIQGKDGLPANRLVCCYTKQEQEPSSGSLTIRDQFGKYTAAYIALTREFHFNDLRS